MLYSPKVPPYASPPRRFPPPLQLQDTVRMISTVLTVSLAVLLIQVFTVNVSSSCFQSKGDVVAGTLILILEVATLACLGYYVTSKIYLKRQFWYTSRYGTSTEFWKLILGGVPALICFAIGESVNIPAMKRSLVLDKETPGMGTPDCLGTLAPELLIAQLKIVFHEFSLKGFVSDAEEPARILSLPYVLCFILGLQFVFADRIPVLQSIGCKVVEFSRWNQLAYPEVCIVSIASVVIAAFFADHCHNLVVHERLEWQLMKYVIVATFIYSMKPPQKKLSDSPEFHAHHYLMAFLLLTLTGFPYRHISYIQAILLGMFVEGAATW